MNHAGLFDWHERSEQFGNGGDPLVKLNDIVNWKLFASDLNRLRDNERKINTSCKSFDAILMFKILILQSLYNLFDDQTEFQIHNRLSFIRFLDLVLRDWVLNAKMIWLFQEQLTEADLAERLFKRFDKFYVKMGLRPQKARLWMPVLCSLLVSATAAKKISKSRRTSFPIIGAKTRSAKRTLMHAGPKRMARTIMVTRTIPRSITKTN